MNIGVLIYSYDRLDDARINMEIVRHAWSENQLFANVKIVHSFNGNQQWWRQPYLEDDLVYLTNSGHLSGAENLVNEGMGRFFSSYPDTDYIIVLASDTWLVKPEYPAQVIKKMHSGRKYLATSAWGDPGNSDLFRSGMALDFFIIDAQWAKQNNLFPLRYSEFFSKYSELLAYMDMVPIPEGVFGLRFQQAIARSRPLVSEDHARDESLKHIHRMVEREPVHALRKRRFWSKPYKERLMYWPSIGLLTHHDPIEKQLVFRSLEIACGEHGKRFVRADSLDYFNRAPTPEVSPPAKQPQYTN
jgi:hypothetical protein